MSSVKVAIKTEEDLKAKFEEMAHILHNLRFYTKYWERHHGYQAKINKDRWQQKADKILDELGLTLHNNTNAIKIVRE